MSALTDLYQDLIVDHNRSPRNYRKMTDASHHADGHNPLCGDKLSVYLKVNDDNKVEDISFVGQGCAISVAAASLMTQTIKGKTVEEAEQIFGNFHHLMTDKEVHIDEERLGKLAALAGVREYPSRIKCATLCWHALHAALRGEQTPAKTE
jgi:nitrogen fixation NifU-like protein